jgi:sensor histidine kinase YesM
VVKFSYNRFRIIAHLLFWLLVLGFYTLLFGSESSDYSGAFRFVIMLLPITIGTTYFLNYYLVPRYILQKKYLLFVLYFIYTFIVSITLGLNIVLLTFVVIADFNVSNMVPASFNIIYLVAGNYLVVLFAVVIKLINQWYKMDNRNLLLEKQSMELELKLKEAELKLLKAQIHPHFLFNTLNNLYGLVLSGSENAPDIVLRISSLLDYMLYQSAKPFVYVKEEIQYIRDYIELERLRYANLEIKINEKGSLEDLKIAPMILQPFVENAFKHGISKDVDNQWLKIDIELTGSRLNFNIENPKYAETENERSGNFEGIGLSNVKRRLEILYLNRHDLSIRESNDNFRIELKLELEQ